MITAIFAAYAIGVAGHLSKNLAGLLIGRLLNGFAIGIVASSVTAYLADLHAVGRPQASAQQAALS